jgi:thiamine pyrophosphate-dependent acetolactate synthase large subunit-like protein
MRELVAQLLDNRLSRRGFFQAMAAAGFTATAIEGIIGELEAAELPDDDRSGTYRTVTGNGGELWVEQLKASGVEYLFTNPGSTETGFFDAFVDTPGIQLINCLHEGIVISAADGYATVTGKTAFVNVHAMVGTAQMCGQLYNAHKAKSPMVVTAGMSDNSVFSDYVGLGAKPGSSQSEVTRQFTKISWDVREPGSIPVALRRAFKVASTPPGGPVYLAMATYAQGGKEVTAQIVDQAKFNVPMRSRPDKDRIELVAKRLIEGDQPLFITSDDLYRSDAIDEAIELVEMLGVPILDAGSSSSNCGFPSWHSHYWDNKAFGRSDGVDPFDRYDVIVGLGADEFTNTGARGEVAPIEIGRAPNSWKAAIGVDIDMMGRSAPIDLAVVADPKAGIEDLRDAINSMITKERLNKIRDDRSRRVTPRIAAYRADVEAEAKGTFGKTPMHPHELAVIIERNIDKDAITVNESLSHDFSMRHNAIQRFGGGEKRRITSGGGSLGYGIGAAIGAKIGEPDRQVVLNIGDGSVMYSASGFWTMARYSIPLLTIVWNNRNYQTVRHGFSGFDGKMEKSGHYAGMYLGAPNIDYVGLAQAQGVSGEKAETASEFETALKRGIAATRSGEPYIIEVMISRIGGGADSNWYQAFNLAETRTRKV